jgi:GNAT superfamily N-acetyltransferase
VNAIVETMEHRANITIEPLDRSREDLVDLVAQRMRDTLIEVLGPRRGASMYSLDWLRERVRAHLDPDARRAAVLLAYDSAGAVVGHTILRLEAQDGVSLLGLFSTTYVTHAMRRSGVAGRLLEAGEKWLIARGAATLATDTDENNLPLRNLYERRGYSVVFHDPNSQMIRLARAA